MEEKKIVVYGTGCKKCEQLHANALEAAQQMRVPTDVDYVTDIAAIASAGVTPLAVIEEDGERYAAHEH